MWLGCEVVLGVARQLWWSEAVWSVAVQCVTAVQSDVLLGSFAKNCSAIGRQSCDSLTADVLQCKALKVAVAAILQVVVCKAVLWLAAVWWCRQLLWITVTAVL